MLYITAGGMRRHAPCADRLVTSLDMIFDIQAGETEFKFLCRSVCHIFPNIAQADSADFNSLRSYSYALDQSTRKHLFIISLWIAVAMATM